MSELDDVRARLAAWKEEVEILSGAARFISTKAESWRLALLEMTKELEEASRLFAERASALVGEAFDIAGDDFSGFLPAIEGLTGVQEALDGMSSRLMTYELGQKSDEINAIGVQASGAADHAARAYEEARSIEL